MAKKEAKKAERNVSEVRDTVAPDSLEAKFISSHPNATRADENGMKWDPLRGTEVPTHYPAAYVINDTEGEMVKHPEVTPDEYNDKVNPQDAKTTDSEFIIRAPDMATANELAESERSGLPKEARETNKSS
jgi:hypothetical protein